MAEKKSQSTLYTQRVIYLKNGVKQGNPNQNAKRCGAKTRTTGQLCKGMAIRGKSRCRLHGGKSTGARTREGLESCRKANWRHGMYSLKAKLIKHQLNKLIDLQSEILKQTLNTTIIKN